MKNLIVIFGLVFCLSAQAQPGGEKRLAIATFAGGCFWCMESDMDKVKGVVKTISGYMGGKLDNPTYQQVSAGGTGHAEVVQVTYDTSQISYSELLEVFWKNIDPTVRDQQFCDHGNQYRTAIFYHDEAQHKAALASLQALQQHKPFEEEIVTEITAAGKFYPAEEYHQDFYRKNPLRYKYYRFACGRDSRLEALWGKRH